MQQSNPSRLTAHALASPGALGIIKSAISMWAVGTSWWRGFPDWEKVGRGKKRVEERWPAGRIRPGRGGDDGSICCKIVNPLPGCGHLCGSPWSCTKGVPLPHGDLWLLSWPHWIQRQPFCCHYNAGCWERIGLSPKSMFVSQICNKSSVDMS